LFLNSAEKKRLKLVEREAKHEEEIKVLEQDIKEKRNLCAKTWKV
jgi:hypothetical protein